MKKIILASNNLGKITEIRHVLKSLPIDILPQSAFNITDVAETGQTFIENAIIKARNAAEISELPALADDSGLCVLALNGAPGIYSARYAGARATAEECNAKLLATMQNITDRRAYYYCAVVLLRHASDPAPWIALGQWHGEILTAPSGNLGFGYDPIFYVNNLHCSAAQLDIDTKNCVSHRGQAMQKLLQQATLWITEF